MSWWRRLDLDRPDPSGIAKRSSLSLLGVGVQGSVRFVSNILIGRLLTPAVLGATNGAISLALFISVLWPTNYAVTVSKFVARARGGGHDQLVTAIVRHLAFSALWSSVVLGGAAYVFSRFLLGAPDELTSILTGLLVVAWSMYSFVRALHFTVGQVSRATVWDIISAVIAIALLIAVIAFDAEPLLLAPLTIGYLLYAACGIPRLRSSTRLSRELKREMTGFTAWSTIAAVAATGLIQLGMVAADVFVGGTEAGYYAAALSLATPLSLVARSLSLVLFPSVAESSGRGDHDEVRRHTELVTRGIVAVMGAAFGSLAVVAPLLLVVFFGERYVGASSVLVILIAATYALTLNVGAVNSLNATSSAGARSTAMLSIVGILAGVGTTAALLGGFGILGIAGGYLVGAIIIGIGPIVLVALRDGSRYAGLLVRSIAGVVFAAVCILVPAWLQLPVWATLGAALVFLVGWLALLSPELRMIASLRRTRGSE